jgi:hypothetical protein
MAKSSTRKKFNKTPPKSVTREISTLATAYVKQWTQKELGRLQQQQNPICIPTNTGYKIGLYSLVVNSNRTCELFDHNSELVHVFDTKINAVLYTIYTIKHKYWVSDQILTLDKEINKNYVDAQTLRRGIQLAQDLKDFYKVDIKQARLEIAEKKLELARDKISKIYKTAKYYKVWEETK